MLRLLMIFTSLLLLANVALADRIQRPSVPPHQTIPPYGITPDTIPQSLPLYNFRGFSSVTRVNFQDFSLVSDYKLEKQ